MGLFEKQIPKYVQTLEGTPTVEPVVVDDIFDPLFNEEVRAMLEQKYGNAIALNGYKELLNNIWIENDGALGKGMGLLSAFGRSMEKADDLILGAATEAVEGVSGQGFDNPLKQIFVEDEDYTGRRFLAAAANTMRGFADGTTVTEEDFGPEWGLPALGIDLISDVGILGSGLSKAYAPHLTQGAQRVSSSEIFRNLGKSGNAKTTIGEVGQLLSDYDDLMTKVAIDVTAPGLRFALKNLMDKIATHIGAASYRDYADYTLHKGAPDTGFEAGPSTKADGADFKTDNGTHPPEPQDNTVAGLTTLYENVRRAYESTPEPVAEMVQRVTRTPAEVAEEVMHSPSWHLNDLLDRRYDYRNEMLARVVRQYLNQTSQNQVRPQHRYSARLKSPGAPAPSEIAQPVDIDTRVRDVVVALIDQGVQDVDAAAVGLWVQKQLKAGKEPTEEDIIRRLSKIDNNISSVFNADVHRGTGTGTYTRQGNVDGIEDDGESRAELREAPAHVRRRIRNTLGEGRRMADAVVRELRPALSEVSKIKFEMNTTLSEGFSKMQERASELGVAPQVFSEVSSTAYAMPAVQRVVDAYYASLKDPTKHLKIANLKDDLKTIRNSLIVEHYANPSNSVLGPDFNINGKAIDGAWDTSDWREFARRIAERDWEYQSTVSFLEGYSSQRDVARFKLSNSKWHVSPSEKALFASPKMSGVYTALNQIVQALKYPMHTSAAHKPLFESSGEFNAFMRSDRMTTLLYNLFGMGGATDVTGTLFTKGANVPVIIGKINKLINRLNDVMFNPTTDVYEMFKKVDELIAFVDYNDLLNISAERYNALRQICPEELAYIEYVDEMLDVVGTEFVARVHGWGIPRGDQFFPADRPTRSASRYAKPDKVDVVRDDYSEGLLPMVKAYTSGLAAQDLSVPDMAYVTEPIRDFVQIALNDAYEVEGPAVEDAKFFLENILPKVERLLQLGGNPFKLAYRPQYFKKEDFEFLKNHLEGDDRKFRKMLQSVMLNPNHNFAPLSKELPDSPSVAWLRSTGDPRVPSAKRPVAPTFINSLTGKSWQLSPHKADAFKVTVPSKFDHSLESLSTYVFLRADKVAATDANDDQAYEFVHSVSKVWRAAEQRLKDALKTIGRSEKDLGRLLSKFYDSKTRYKLTPQELRDVYYYTQVYSNALQSIPYHIIQTDARFYQADPQRFVQKYLTPKLAEKTPDMSDQEYEQLVADWEMAKAEFDEFVDTVFASPDPLYSEALRNFTKTYVDNAPPQIANAWNPSAEKGIFNFNLSPQATPYYITLGETLPMFNYDAQILSRYNMTAGAALTAAKKNPYIVHTGKGDVEYARYLGALDYVKLRDPSVLNDLARISANITLGMKYFDTSATLSKSPDEFFNELRARYASNRVARRNLVRRSKASENALERTATPLTTSSTQPTPPPPVKETPKPITSFRGDHKFLSNMYECPVSYNGLLFRSSEAAFQAQKDPSRAHEFVGLSGSQAKKLGKTVKLRSDWSTVRDSIMTDVLWNKFTQNPELMEALQLTGDAELIEGNTWGDTYWGVDTRSNKGNNNLGKILMDIRKANPIAKSHAVQETSEAVESTLSYYENAPAEAVIDAIENPEKFSTAEETFDRTVAEYCPEIKESMDSGATAEQAEEMFEESWNLFRKISEAKAVRSRNAEGDYASLRHRSVRLAVSKVRDFMQRWPDFDYRAYYTLKARRSGDIVFGKDFWKELRNTGMMATCLPADSDKIDRLEAVLQRNVDKLNRTLGDEYFTVVVQPTVPIDPSKTPNTVTIAARFVGGKYDVCAKIDKCRKKIDALTFETVEWAAPETLDYYSQQFMDATGSKELDALEQELANLTQEFYKLLGFTFDDPEYSRHVMNRNSGIMMYLQNNFYREIPSEDLDDIVDQLSILYDERGTFGTKLYGRRYRGHYWNLEKGAPNLFSYDPLVRVKSSLSNGALANNQLQTYIDLFFNDNFAIKEWFNTPDDLKKVLYAKGPNGRSGNFENLKLVTYKLDGNGKIVGVREFDKSTDKGLQEALDTPGTILIPSEVVTHLDYILKRERKMSNKLWVFANKLTGAFKLGVLMNPGFLMGNASDAWFKTVTAMSEKYGTSFEEEVGNFVRSVKEVINLKNNFVDAFEEYRRVLNEFGVHIAPEESVPDNVAMSPRYSKTFEAWLRGELTYETSETIEGETLSHIETIDCTLTEPVKERVRYWMKLQRMQMDTSKMREAGEIAGVFKRSKYAYNRGIDRVFSGTGAYSASDISTWGIFANPAVKAVTDSSEWIEEMARTAMLHNDLRHSGYAPGQSHKRKKVSADAHSFHEEDVAYENAMNTMYSAHFNYEDTPDFMDGLSDFIPFPIFFLKNFYFWMELFLENPQYVDNVMDVQDGLWAHRSEDEEDEYSKAAKGRGSIPIGDGGDGQGLSNFFKGYYKASPLQSMYGAFSLLNDPVGDLQYRLHPALTGAASVTHSVAPTPLTTAFDPEENWTYRPYSTDPYQKNLKPGDEEYNPLEFAIHRANPVERAFNSHIRVPGKAKRGDLQIADFFPSLFQPEY